MPFPPRWRVNFKPKYTSFPLSCILSSLWFHHQEWARFLLLNGLYGPQAWGHKSVAPWNTSVPSYLFSRGSLTFLWRSRSITHISWGALCLLTTWVKIPKLTGNSHGWRCGDILLVIPGSGMECLKAGHWELWWKWSFLASLLPS